MHVFHIFVVFNYVFVCVCVFVGSIYLLFYLCMNFLFLLFVLLFFEKQIFCVLFMQRFPILLFVLCFFLSKNVLFMNLWQILLFWLCLCFCFCFCGFNLCLIYELISYFGYLFFVFFVFYLCIDFICLSLLLFCFLLFCFCCFFLVFDLCTYLLFCYF
jgi:hypothetical protein